MARMAAQQVPRICLSPLLWVLGRRVTPLSLTGVLMVGGLGPMSAQQALTLRAVSPPPEASFKYVFILEFTRNPKLNVKNLFFLKSLLKCF